MPALTAVETNLQAMLFLPELFEYSNSSAILHSFKAIKVHTHLCPTFLKKWCLKVHWCCSSPYASAAAIKILGLGSA